MYQEHTKDTGQIFAEDIYDLVWALTEGQPWLVNALAYEVCFEIWYILPDGSIDMFKLLTIFNSFSGKMPITG